VNTQHFNAAIELSSLLEKYNANKVFLVSGKGSYMKSGAKELFRPSFSNLNVLRFSDFDTGPEIEGLERGVSLFRQFDPDVVVAVGGGSIIDMAKLILSTASTIDSNILDILEAKEIYKNIALIAIPTTAGSGSEATQFAVLYVDGVKHSVDSPALLPDHAVLDSTLTQSMSAYQAAVSGIDVLCQAIESYWSVNSTEESKDYSEMAIKLVLNNISISVNDCTPESRKEMLRAAHYAGKAINITRTTAPHAMSYILTSQYGIPHGQGVALTLGSVFSINIDCKNRVLNELRGCSYLEKTMQSLCEIFECVDSKGFISKFTKILKSIGLKSTFSQLNIDIDEAAVERIVNNINVDRLKNNPVAITKDDIRLLIMDIH